jgi:excisionase family DNA binding protein
VTSSPQLLIAREHLLTVGQVAERLQISPRTVWRLIHDGRLPAVRIGRAVRLHPDAVAALIKAQLNVMT